MIDYDKENKSTYILSGLLSILKHAVTALPILIRDY